MNNGSSSTLENRIRSLLESNLQVILTGAPGTGKTYTAKEVAKAMVGAKISKGATESAKKRAKDAEEEHMASVQFHPGYDYSDFVIGMKPKLIGEKGKEQVAFDWEDGVFKRFADRAKRNPDRKYVFLIDEINRADLSRVFGELFSLLEEEYRYPNEKGTGIKLPNGDTFVIPKNLYIIGTMNDIDRSVESMDFALRRRFAWMEVKPQDTADAILKTAPHGIRAKMDAVNELIRSDDRLGDEYQLGGAIFARIKKYAQEGDKASAFDSLWNRHIVNILSEYLRGRHDKKDMLEKLKTAYDAAGGDDAATNTEDKNNNELNGPSHSAGQKMKIVVQDGLETREIREKSAAETLRKFIEYVYKTQHDKGIRKIMQQVKRGKFPLIVTELPKDYKQANYYEHIFGRYYLHTHSSNSEKKKIIVKIAKSLGIEVHIEGGERHQH